MPEGLGSPWHVHPEEDEWFYVLEGELTFWVADTRLSLKAGSFVFGPKGVPHTFYAEAGGARALVGFAPMQFEGFRGKSASPHPNRPPPPRRPPGHGAARPIAKRNGFRSSAPQARLPATDEATPPPHVRSPHRAGAQPSAGEDRELRHHHTHRQQPWSGPRREGRKRQIDLEHSVSTG